MDLADALRGKAIDIVVRVITHVVRTDHNVADITQQLASRADRNLSEKLGLCNGGRSKSDVTSRVLDQISPGQHILDLMHLPDNNFQSFFVIRQRKKIIEVFITKGRPCEMP